MLVLTSINVGTWSISGNDLTESVFGNTLTSASGGFTSVNPFQSETAFITVDADSLQTAIAQSGFLYSQKDLTITSLKTNGNITLTPSGTGAVILSKTLNANSNKITNLGTPTATTDATTKTYVDTLVSGYLPLAGGTMAGAIVMGANKISGQIVSRPWLDLGTGATTSQGALSWSTILNNPDFSSYYTVTSQFITFSATGYYRISISATFSCTNVNAPERQVFIEFRTSGTLLASASDQVIAAESGTVYGNAAFNRIINITSTAGSTYYFNWGSFATGGTSVTLTSDTHATIERLS